MSNRIFIVFSFLLLGACSRVHSDFNLVPEYKAATNTYFSGTASAAESALRQFVTRTEVNLEIARTDRHGEYLKLLSISWLRLASIYRAETNTKKYREAMTKAVSYFDQDPANIPNPKYQNDKEGCLVEFLNQIEATDTPIWKKIGISKR